MRGPHNTPPFALPKIKGFHKTNGIQKTLFMIPAQAHCFGSTITIHNQ